MEYRIRWENKNFDDMGTLTAPVQLSWESKLVKAECLKGFFFKKCESIKRKRKDFVGLNRGWQRT